MFKFRSFLQPKSVNDVYKLLQLGDPYGSFAPALEWGLLSSRPPCALALNKNSWRRQPATDNYTCDTEREHVYKILILCDFPFLN